MDGIGEILEAHTGGGVMRIPAPEQSPDEMALENLVEQYGGQQRAEVKFYRVTRGEADALLEKMPPSEFDFLHLAKKYGRGTYRVRVYAPDPMRDGRLVLRVNQIERYEGEVDVPQIMPAQHAATAPQSDAMAQAVLAMGQMMAQGFEQLGKLIVQAQPKADTMQDMLQNMVLMREAMGVNIQPQGGMGGMSEMIGLLKQGIELGKDMTTGGGPEDNVSSMLRLGEKILPSLAGLAEQAMKNKPAMPAAPGPALALRAPTPRPDAAGSPAASVESQVITHPQGENEMFGINKYTPFKGQIAQLVDAVERNKETDPYAYAVLLLDNLPDAAVDVILNDAKLVDNLAEVDPRIKDHRPWFDSLAATLRELTTEEQPATVDAYVPPESALTSGNNGDKPA